MGLVEYNRPHLLVTTRAFLEFAGLRDLADLPPLSGPDHDRERQHVQAEVSLVLSGRSTDTVHSGWRCQVVWLWRAWTCHAARVLPDGCVSVTHSGLSDVLPGVVCLGAKLSVGGGGQSVSTWAEVVGDSAERDQKTLRVLG